MDPTEKFAVSEILEAARIPWSQLDCRTQWNGEGKVVKLRFAPCFGLDELPIAIGRLSSLEEIYLFWASRRLTHLPSDGFDRLHNLRILQIRWCQGLRELPRLCHNLEELVIEGCSDIVNLSCFRTAKKTWKKLRSLHIIQIGAHGVASLVEAFSTEGCHDACNGKVSKSIQSGKLLDRIPLVYFPSLTCLSLRHNSIDQVELAKLWPFFRCCPRLIKIDLGSNQISSLKDLVPVATEIGSLESDTQRVPQMALRELNFAGNPVCDPSPCVSSYSFDDRHADENDLESVQDDDSDSRRQEDIEEESERGKSQIPGHGRQEEYLLSIITANPQLVSILVCSGDCKLNFDRNGSGYHHNHWLSQNRCPCFQSSALYSPRIRHALDLNQCSKGKTLIEMRRTISHGMSCNEVPKPFSLSKWPLVLNRTNQISAFYPCIDGNTPSPSLCPEHCEGCSSEIECHQSAARKRALRERQASVIYSLLQGPAFAARGNQ